MLPKTFDVVLTCIQEFIAFLEVFWLAAFTVVVLKVAKPICFGAGRLAVSLKLLEAPCLTFVKQWRKTVGSKWSMEGPQVDDSVDMLEEAGI